jgi:hypothetical protein
MQDGGLHWILPIYLVLERACFSLRRQDPFANLDHADRAFARQMVGDRAPGCIFREPEPVAGRESVIDHQP